MNERTVRQLDLHFFQQMLRPCTEAVEEWRWKEGVTVEEPSGARSVLHLAVTRTEVISHQERCAYWSLQQRQQLGVPKYTKECQVRGVCVHFHVNNSNVWILCQDLWPSLLLCSIFLLKATVKSIIHRYKPAAVPIYCRFDICVH